MFSFLQIPLSPGGGLRGKGPLGLEGESADAGPQVFDNAISTAVGIMTLIALIWFVFVFLGGAYGVITAGGDKAQLEAARKKIISGIIGVVMMVAAVFLINLIGNLIGLPDILSPSSMLQSIIDAI